VDRRQILTALVALTAAGRLAAQGLIVWGTVRDEAGKPLPGVTVKLMTQSQGVRIGATNSAGEFRFRDLATGFLELAFEKDGYTTITRRVDVTYDKNNDDDDNGIEVTLVPLNK